MKAATAKTGSGGEYPNKAVRLIEGFGAGGGPDLIARALAPKPPSYGNRLSPLRITPVPVARRRLPSSRRRRPTVARCSSTLALTRTARRSSRGSLTTR